MKQCPFRSYNLSQYGIIMAARIYMFLLFFTEIFFIDRGVFGHKIVTVANYNIWNVMFQWETRKQFIAEMVILSFS